MSAIVGNECMSAICVCARVCDMQPVHVGDTLVKATVRIAAHTWSVCHIVAHTWCVCHTACRGWQGLERHMRAVVKATDPTHT